MSSSKKTAEPTTEVEEAELVEAVIPSQGESPDGTVTAIRRSDEEDFVEECEPTGFVGKAKSLLTKKVIGTALVTVGAALVTVGLLALGVTAIKNRTVVVDEPEPTPEGDDNTED